MAGRFEGKVALITGGASGIGRATALAFAREGAKVAVADMVVEGGNETVHAIEQSGSQAIFIRTDVSVTAEVEAMVNKVVETYGRLDCAHNNAGIEGVTVSTVDYPEEVFDRVMSINVKGVWLCMKYEIPQMIKQGGGAIVNTSSTAGLVGDLNMSAYNASKHGVLGLTKCAAIENSAKGVRINAVCPGAIDTPMIDRLFAGDVSEKRRWGSKGLLGDPEEVAAVVVWLCSDAASFVTGHPMSVDGGYYAKGMS